MNKKIGQIVESKLKDGKMNVSEFAKKLGKDRSTVYDMFLRDSLDTKLLEKIGQVLDYDFFQDLLQEKTKQEIIIKNSISNKILIELNLTEEQIENLKLKDLVIKKIFET